MHIFIDESGTFVYAEEPSGWSTISAIVIPEKALGEAKNALDAFKAENGYASTDELKLGKLKDEISYFRLLARLERANCTLFGIATDAQLNTPGAVDAHKEGTAQGILKNLEKMRYEAGRKLLLHAADQVRRLSCQLHIQFICQIELMYYVVSQAITYYAQHDPATLSQFVWRVDQKALEKITEYEEVFERLSPAYLQMMSLSDPVMMIADFDYSHLAGYELLESETPVYLKDDYDIDIDVDLEKALNIQKIVRGDMQFVDSKEEFGIQLADLLSAGLRRCLRSGFKDSLRAATFLGRLMVQRVQNNYPLLLVSLGEEGTVDKPTAALINMMRRQQRPMLKREVGKS
ncbi:DUF3800 domain-containing protein [Pseudomonas tremae]|uniref:DUF3800 domain-containing protein n=2 Tax=Pseudomonas syringae group TaxID=136849 RepID=A0AB37QP87_9PSED|nr:DUF3800 domain-containing protein [Pseudomonas coronafaciens]RMS00117.1 hypothetical protein ALP74_200011 [Pseudomonas coronafaciens pv. garcae]